MLHKNLIKVSLSALVLAAAVTSFEGRAAAVNWQTLITGMDSSMPPAVTKGTENNLQRVNAYAIDPTQGLWNFDIDVATQTVTPSFLGGQAFYAPTAVEWTNHREVYIVGADGGLYRRVSTNGTSFNGWQRILTAPPGTSICSAPSAVSWGGTRIDVYMVGCDGSLRHAWTANATSWAWDNRGGSGLHQSPGPQAQSWASGRLDVWVLDANAVLWDNQYNGSTYTWRATSTPAVSWFGSASITPGSNDAPPFIGQVVGPLLFDSFSFDPSAIAGNIASIGMSSGSGPTNGKLSGDLLTGSRPVLARFNTSCSMMYVVDGDSRVFRRQLCNPFTASHPQVFWFPVSLDLWNSGMQVQKPLAAIWVKTSPVSSVFFVFAFKLDGSLIFTLDTA